MIIDFDILTVFAGLVIFILYIVYSLRKGVKNKQRFLFDFIMFVYIMCVAKETIFPIPIEHGLPSNIYQNINIIPFKDGIGETEILNIIMMIPYGFIRPFVSTRRRFYQSIISGGCFSVSIELIQFLESFFSNGFTLRVIDITDVICNVFGVIIGFEITYLIAAFLMKHLRLEHGNDNEEDPFWQYVKAVWNSLLNSRTK